MTEKIYKQLIQLNNNKKQTTQLKNGRKIKEDMQMANRHIKRWSSLLIIRETQIKTTVRQQFIQSNWSSSKSLQITNAGEGVKKREPSYTVGGNVSWCNHYRKQYGGFSENTKQNYHMIQVFHFCYIYPDKTVIQKESCRTSLIGTVVKTLPFNTGSVGSIPGQRTKVPHAVGCGQKKIFLKLLTLLCSQHHNSQQARH